MSRPFAIRAAVSRVAVFAAVTAVATVGLLGAAGQARADLHPVLFGSYNRVWAAELGAAHIADWQPRTQAMQSWFGRPQAIDHILATSTSTPADVVATLNAVWSDSNVPMLTYYPRTQVSSVNGATTGNSNIAAGLQDTNLQPFVSALKGFVAGPDGRYGTADDRRLYFRPAPEANGDWSGYSPNTVYGNNQHPSDSVYAQNVGSFKAMWKHIHDLFGYAGIGPSRVQFVFNVDVDESWRANHHIAEDIYPGDAYVDWVTMDGYNRGPLSKQGTRTPDQVFAGMLTRLRTIAPMKPVGITEVGTVSAGATNDDKNAWINALYAWLSGPGSAIRMVCWWNQDDTSSSNYGVFGAGSGDSVYSSTAGSFNAFSGYRSAITANTWLSGSSASDPRLMSDAAFMGA